MNPDQVAELGQEAILTSLTVAAPFLIVGVVAAILLGIGQAMIHVQDQTVSFVPKLFLIAVTALICFSWCSERLVDYSRDLYKQPALQTDWPIAPLNPDAIQVKPLKT